MHVCARVCARVCVCLRALALFRVSLWMLCSRTSHWVSSGSGSLASRSSMRARPETGMAGSLAGHRAGSFPAQLTCLYHSGGAGVVLAVAGRSRDVLCVRISWSTGLRSCSSSCSAPQQRPSSAVLSLRGTKPRWGDFTSSGIAALRRRIVRITFEAYFAAGLVMCTFTHPLLAHWIWQGGWLSTGNWRVIDFAGGIPVHVCGGLFALIGAKMVGPRRGRFVEDGSGGYKDGGLKKYNVVGPLHAIAWLCIACSRVVSGCAQVFSALGVFLLWIGCVFSSDCV